MRELGGRGVWMDSEELEAAITWGLGVGVSEHELLRALWLFGTVRRALGL